MKNSHYARFLVVVEQSRNFNYSESPRLTTSLDLARCLPSVRSRKKTLDAIQRKVTSCLAAYLPDESSRLLVWLVDDEGKPVLFITGLIDAREGKLSRKQLADWSEMLLPQITCEQTINEVSIAVSATTEFVFCENYDFETDDYEGEGDDRDFDIAQDLVDEACPSVDESYVSYVERDEGSTLDGFTITNVGVYDAALWKKHFESHGEELGDDEGSVQAEGTSPAISIQGVNCTVTNCIVHHNGDVGIGVLGKENTKTAPLIANNFVFRNMGIGIGVAEGAEPIIRGNTCKENLRAGIGCRKANPIIMGNMCFQNIRAGIGCREGSKPVIRDNKCYQNRRAGIGIRMDDSEFVCQSRSR
ncbi:right-handed parallel beta-helix repeat-containing protein [Rhodopirellula sp. SWK7]|uniref:right-handed parallel beta-helix repeat-containing protein n=1 Tax=Rhodopirellula sp. SWK7 TaxID=595460 RepID=UPI0002BE2DD6|nr:right-handed parallel beta-helix repeat-containing protein [Rhodopirellula sp. SWK7]EMI41639.1 hypothetical protein RRSWK_05855 [Rhodopirellula sp. SWK7]